MSDHDDLARLIHDEAPTARAEAIADAVLAAGWVPAKRLRLIRDSVRDVETTLRGERDALAATVDRARVLCDDPQAHLDERAVRGRYERIRAALEGDRHV